MIFCFRKDFFFLWAFPSRNLQFPLGRYVTGSARASPASASSQKASFLLRGPAPCVAAFHSANAKLIIRNTPIYHVNCIYRRGNLGWFLYQYLLLFGLLCCSTTCDCWGGGFNNVFP